MHFEDIALSFVPNLTNGAIAHLIDIFGSAKAIYSATEKVLVESIDLRSDIATNICNKAGFKEAERELELCTQRGIKILSASERSYPVTLKFMPDHPHIIYMVGDNSLLSCSSLCAITGERDNLSSYGEKVTFKLLEQIAAIMPEVVIVGALEGGADSVALRGAVHFGLRAIGVVNAPLTQIAPQSCAHLADEILQSGGLIISEVGCTATSKDDHLAPHHRIIAGLCRGVVVIESSKIPQIARFADSYGRPLLAVPGRVTDSMSWGTNSMIATSMAQMVCTGKDIVEQLFWY